jgi:hypothetical protein
MTFADPSGSIPQTAITAILPTLLQSGYQQVGLRLLCLLVMVTTALIALCRLGLKSQRQM